MSLHRFARPVITARPDELVADVARKLRDHRVGCVVVERNGKPFGIVTDRDVAIRVVAEGLDPGTAHCRATTTSDSISM